MVWVRSSKNSATAPCLPLHDQHQHMSEKMPGTEPIRHAVAVPVGGEIAVLEWPTVQADAPALMLAHANGFCAQLWRAVAVSLSKHYRVFAYDARGHGETTLDASEQQLHWDVLHDDLIALLERLPTRFNLRLILPCTIE